jgi:hypothetical protein
MTRYDFRTSSRCPKTRPSLRSWGRTGATMAAGRRSTLPGIRYDRLSFQL